MSGSRLFCLARQYHDALPSRIRHYLNERGIPDTLIDRHLLGWNGWRITIPIFDRDGNVAFFKLARDPEDSAEAPKMLATLGARAELYGWEHLREKPRQIIICEGEFDRLVLEAQGFKAVTSTGGAGVFRKEWADALAAVPEVYACFDRDEAGRNGVRRAATLTPRARVVELPEEVGDGGDVTVCPYLVFAAETPQSKHKREEFIVGNVFQDDDIHAKLDAYDFERLYVAGDNPTCRACSLTKSCGKGCPAAVIAAGKRLGDLDDEVCPTVSAENLCAA